MKSLLSSLAGWLISLYLIAPSNVSAAFFLGLGDLPGGGNNSLAYGISGDGKTVVGASSSSATGLSGREAYRWTLDTGMQGLGGLTGQPYNSSHAYGASYDGGVVVGLVSPVSSANESFIWDKVSGMQGFGGSAAYDVSADGTTVTGRYNRQAYVWTEAAGFTTLGLDPNQKNSAGRGISNDGSTVVGEMSTSNREEAFLWSSSVGYTGLGDLPGSDFVSRAFAVSADGSTAVGESFSSLGTEAFRWTAEGGMVGLGMFMGGIANISTATDVSGDGSIIVGSSYASGGEQAFIWDKKNGMRKLADVLVNDYGLDLDGWYLSNATGISDDGLTIVGHGGGDGFTQAWIARIDPVPIPAAIYLFGSGLIGLVGMARRKAVL